MFEYSKETTEKTKAEVAIVKSQIKLLQPTTVKAFGKDITVVHRLMRTMIDGKVCQALTDTPSSSTCVVCKLTPKQMNDLQDVANRQERGEVFSFGLSTLHAWIRFMDCILHIAYNLQFKTWSAKTPAEKNAKAASKSHIQKASRQQT
jgi:hypothetical protein